METSNNGLAAALVVAQSKMSNPKFDAVNPHFRNRYASLSAVREAVIPPLNSVGIGVIQNIVEHQGGIGCETILTYKNGESMKLGPLPMPASKQDAQGYGSAITYACRYALCAIAGVTGEEDDDGEAASRPQQQAVGRPTQPAKPLFKKNPPKPEANRAMELITKTEAAGLRESDIKAFVEAKQAWPAGCERVADLKPSIIERLLDKDVFTTLINFANNAEVQS